MILRQQAASQNRIDVLVFAEDPGAANYLWRVPARLGARGRNVRTIVSGLALPFFQQKGVDCEVVPTGAVAEDLIGTAPPRVILVGTSEDPATMGLKLLAEARKRGITSIGAVDGLANAAYRFRGKGDGPLGYKPDWLIVPDGWTKDAYTALGFDACRIAICGHPQYDVVLEEAERLGALDRRQLRTSLLPAVGDEERIVVFLSEVSTGLHPAQYQRSDEYTLTGRGSATERTAIVLEEFLDAMKEIPGERYLVLRLHPKNSIQELSAYVDEFDAVSSIEPPLHIVYAADLVVGMSTMLLTEASLMGRPSLAILPRTIEKEWLPSVRAGLMPNVTTRGELRSALKKMLKGEAVDARGCATDWAPRDSLRRVGECIEQRLQEAHEG